MQQNSDTSDKVNGTICLISSVHLKFKSLKLTVDYLMSKLGLKVSTHHREILTCKRIHVHKKDHMTTILPYSSEKAHNTHGRFFRNAELHKW